jgi:hypothetical protein
MIPELAQLDPVPEEAAFLAFVERLQTDPALSRLVKTWVLWDGDPADAEPPTIDMTPWIRIVATPGPTEWLVQNGYMGVLQVPIVLKMELAIADLSTIARMRFWHLVRSAALPSDPVARPAAEALLAAVGVNNVVNTRSGYGIDSAAEGPLIVSKPEFVLNLTVDA